MIRLEMKNINIVLTEKQRKYQYDHLEKLIKENILQVNKYYTTFQSKGSDRASYVYILSFRVGFRKTNKNN